MDISRCVLGYERYLFECYKRAGHNMVSSYVFWGINGIYLNVIKEQDITCIFSRCYLGYEGYLFERYKRAGHNMDSS